MTAIHLTQTTLCKLESDKSLMIFMMASWLPGSVEYRPV